VRGLGVSDALQVELEDVQLSWLIDELEEMRGPLEESLQLARARCIDDPADGAAAEELEATEHQLRLLRMVRAQLPPSGHGGRVSFVGPTELVLDVVRETTRNVVAALSELVHGQDVGHGDWHTRVSQASGAAAAWVQTFLDCETVELFAFDPSAD
jgi:hypothetical protein